MKTKTRNGARRATPKSDAKHAQVRDNQARALALRIEGYTYDEIAKELGYAGRSGIAELISRALHERPAKNVDEYRRVELERLEELTHAVWWRAMNGDTRSVRAAVLISKRRAVLLGLDAVKPRTDIVVSTGEKTNGPVTISVLYTGEPTAS